MNLKLCAIMRLRGAGSRTGQAHASLGLETDTIAYLQNLLKIEIVQEVGRNGGSEATVRVGELEFEYME